MDIPPCLRLMAAIACIAGCAPRPEEPPSETFRHRCVEIPNGLVECTLITDDAAAPATR